MALLTRAVSDLIRESVCSISRSKSSNILQLTINTISELTGQNHTNVQDKILPHCMLQSSSLITYCIVDKFRWVLFSLQRAPKRKINYGNLDSRLL